MGFSKWLARKGNVGGTARAVARAYISMKRQKPTITVDEAVDIIIGLRYQNGPNKLIVSGLSKGGGRGASLSRLAVAILTVEASFMENTANTKNMFIDVIMEEMVNLGLSESEIFLL
jgi:hypothetical protein